MTPQSVSCFLSQFNCLYDDADKLKKTWMLSLEFQVEVTPDVYVVNFCAVGRDEHAGLNLLTTRMAA
jgi:hypothetical protein